MPLKDKEKRKAYKAAQYIKNRGLVSEQNRAYYAAHLDQSRIAMRAYRIKNKERIREVSDAWDNKNKVKTKATKAAWYIKNKERITEWGKTHPEELKNIQSRYRKKNPEKIKIRNNNRRAQKRSNGGKLSPGISSRLLTLQCGKCAICKKALKRVGFHLDHIIPIARGGGNTDRNIQLTCPKCNQKKGSKDPIAFMQSIGYLL
jgi:5-methylcytosine-specific restriction endonuclease McrA